MKYCETVQSFSFFCLLLTITKIKDNSDNIKTQVGIMHSIDSSKLLAKAKGYDTRIKEMSEK